MPLSPPQMQSLPCAIAIVGPTATGKSALALRLAERFNGEIIAADSRTIYRFLDIGTAKPARDVVSMELSCGCAFRSGGVAHHLIDRLDPSETVSVARFKSLALECIAGIVARKKVPFIVGGTGQYVDAIVHPADFPSVPPDQSLRAMIDNLPMSERLSLLRERDPRTAELIDVKNPRRVARALEIVLATGAVRPEIVLAEPIVRALSLGITLSPPAIRERIEQRVEEQLAAGLQNEAIVLARQYGWDAPALKSIGYHEWRSWYEGSSILNEVRSRLIIDTRQYAKRQMTWFKRDASVCWFDASSDVFLQAAPIVENFLAS